MKTIYAVCLLALVLTGCFLAPRRGGGLEVIPILPPIVEIDEQSHYEQEGYHYFYLNDRWYYSNARDGERRELPRERWPREVHRRGGEHGQGR